MILMWRSLTATCEAACAPLSMLSMKSDDDDDERLADVFFSPTAGPLLDHPAVQFHRKGVWQPLF